MDRRDFLQRAGSLAGVVFFPRAQQLLGAEAGWRTFAVTTRVQILKPSGTTRVWLPAPLIRRTPYQRTLANTIRCENGVARMAVDANAGLAMVIAKFRPGVDPILELTSRVATRDWTVDLTGRADAPQANAAELKQNLRPTRLLPIDGIVKDTAVEITRNLRADVEKARAIYDWIVENTYRNPKTQGCGIGDIRFLLESRDLGGKCADLNALYVGLARAAGLPARDVYGIRTAKSELGYKSLGAASENVSKAQHCRAEVYLNHYGWVPVDPADVRKVMLEEPPGNRPADDEMVKKARARLFGSWEMNWIAYNFAHDVTLPGSTGKPLGFLMYPQAETAAGRLDSLDPAAFKYEVTSREMTNVRG
jgi:transglutaminase-like putative cysteine protease